MPCRERFLIRKFWPLPCNTPVGSTKTVIAIVPKIGTAETLAAPSSSQVSLASKGAKHPFSALLEQASPSVGESLGALADAIQGAAQGSHSLVGGQSKREAKSSDTRSLDSKPDATQGGVNASTQNPAAIPDRVVPVVVVPPQLSSVLPLTTGFKTFISDATVKSADVIETPLNHTVPSDTVLNSMVVSDKEKSLAPSRVESTAKPDGAGQPTKLPELSPSHSPALSEDRVAAKGQEDTKRQDSPSPVNVKSKSAETILAPAVAGLMKDLSGTAADGLKTNPDGAILPARNIARGTDVANNDVNKAQASAKSEIEQILVPPTVAAPALHSSAPAKLDTGGSHGTLAKAVLDKFRVGTTQENSATPRRSLEVTGSAKAQSRKDDTLSSSGSQGDEPSTAGAPPKTIESSAAFILAGMQPSVTASDAKNLTVGVPHDASAQQSGHLDQKSTGAADTHAETMATHPMSIVHSAKLVERIGEAELRLGIRAGEFGSVDVRTSIVHNQFTVQISAERGELGRALAAELPSLQNRLTEQRIPVANITLQNHAGGDSTASEQQKPRDPQPQAHAVNVTNRQAERLMPAMAVLEGAPSTSRLDIHM
jgi:flagellar hook-length control protein FliK